jgi:hypothetical protein
VRSKGLNARGKVYGAATVGTCVAPFEMDALLYVRSPPQLSKDPYKRALSSVIDGHRSDLIIVSQVDHYV